MFGHVPFFNDYPYALPGFVCSLVGLSAAILVTLRVKEVRDTLHCIIVLKLTTITDIAYPP
jgi:hypothetical protein